MAATIQLEPLFLLIASPEIKVYNLILQRMHNVTFCVSIHAVVWEKNKMIEKAET